MNELGLFQHNVGIISSPTSSPSDRHAADQWLTAFQSSDIPWSISRQILQDPSSSQLLDYYAAHILAWKTKKQPHQLHFLGSETEAVQVLTDLLASFYTASNQQLLATARELCQALANVVIHCTQLTKPLQSLAARLNEEALLEFLTVLPGECEDAAVAMQRTSIDAGFALKQRVKDWCTEVGEWIYTLHSRQLYTSYGKPGAGGYQEMFQAMIHSDALSPLSNMSSLRTVTLRVLGCFSSWVKWGCLPYLEPQHTRYLVSLAGSLLFASADDIQLIAASVDAMTEISEHAPDDLLPQLLAIGTQIPAHVCSLVSQGLDCGNVPSVYGAICSANMEICLEINNELGASLRQGMLSMLCLPAVDREGEQCEIATPVVHVLADLFEQALLHQADGHHHNHQRGMSSNDQSDLNNANSSSSSSRPILEFAAQVVDALLIRLQADAHELTQPLAAFSDDGCQIESLRNDAEALIELVTELLGADAVLERIGSLITSMTSTSSQQRAVDVGLYMTHAASSVLVENIPHSASSPAPRWFIDTITLYKMVPSLMLSVAHNGSSNNPSGLQQCTLLHWDFLASFISLAPAVVPLLQKTDPQTQQEVISLILNQSMAALSCGDYYSITKPNNSSGNKSRLSPAACDLRLVSAGSDAVRAFFSFAPSTGLRITSDLLGALAQMMQLLTAAPSSSVVHQSAQRQLIIALVHAVHAVKHGDVQAENTAKKMVEQFVTLPLSTALQQACSHLTQQPQQHLTSSYDVMLLQASLQNIQALFNAFESYLDEYTGNALVYSVAAVVAHQAISSFMSTWHLLGQLCCSGAGDVLFNELAGCLDGCLALLPTLFATNLQPVLETIVTCFFLPGGHAMHRTLCSAIESFGANPAYQSMLLLAAATILCNKKVDTFLTLRGGDSDPETLLSLFSIVVCLLRNAPRWPSVGISQPEALLAVIEKSLQLAAMNSACNHREISQRCMVALTASVLLISESASPNSPLLALKDTLMTLAKNQGWLPLQTIILSLLALNSSVNLPKIVSLMTDIATLATVCSTEATVTNPEALFASSQSVLNTWGSRAKASVLSLNVLAPQVLEGVLAQWDWTPVLQQAAVQVAEKRGYSVVPSIERKNSDQGSSGTSIASQLGVNEAEIRRRVQRSVRQLADALKQNGNY